MCDFRDDHKLLKWNLVNSECIVVATFADDFYPTGMHLFPKLNVSGNKHQHDVILISTADGKLVLLNIIFKNYSIYVSPNSIFSEIDVGIKYTQFTSTYANVSKDPNQN